MASNIKGITVEIGGDTTKLDKALKGVNTSSKSLQGELKKVNSALKMDPTNVTLIKQKQDILRESIEKTKEKLDVLKTTQQQVEKQFENGDIGADQYRAFQREVEATQQKLNTLNQEAKNFGTNVSPSFIAAKEHLSSFGTKATEAGQKMLPLTVGISAIGAGAVKFASDFQSGMSQVAATMGYTTEQLHDSSSQQAQDFEKLKDAAKDMGATTQFSATEASEALNYLALAGYDVDKSISTLPDVLNLAAAGGMELGQACDMVTDASSALNLTTEQTNTLVDQMAKTSQKSNTSVAQLGEAILTVGGTANGLSGGINEMNTALGVLANVGYKSAEGGTHLRNVILSLSAASPGVTKMLQEMGVETLDLQGNMRPLNEILVDLNQGMSTLGSGEKAQVLSTIFNKTDLAAVSGLMSSVTGSTLELSDVMMALDYNVEDHGRTWQDLKNYYDETLDSEEMVSFMMENFGMSTEQATAACVTLNAELGNSSNTWNDLAGEIENASGSAAAQAETMLDNLKGKAILLKSAIEGLGIQIGDILLPFIEVLTTKINGLITWLSNLSPTTQKIIVLIGAVVAALGPVLIIIGKMATGISALMGAYSSIKTVMAATTIAQNGLNLAFLASPITWIIAGIVALVATFAILWNKCDAFREFWINLWEVIKNICSVVGEWLVNFFTITIPQAFNTVIDFVKNNWQGLLLFLVNPFAGAFKLIYDNCETFRNFINNIFTAIRDSIINIWQGICDFFSNLWLTITEIFNSALDFIREYLFTNFSTAIEGAQMIWQGFQDYISNLWEFIKTIFMGALLIICDLVTLNFTQLGADAQSIMDSLSIALNGIWEAIKTMFNGALTYIVGIVTGLFTQAVTGAQTIWNSFVTFMTGIWTALSTGIQNAWSGFVTTISNFCTNILTTATGIWNNIVTTITGIMNSLPGLASTAFNNVCTSVSSALGSLTGIIKSGFQGGIDFIKSLPSQAITWGKDFVDGLVSGIKNSISKVTDAVKDVANNIRSYLHFSVPDVGPLTDYETWMPDFMDGLSNGIENSKNKVVNSIKGLATDMKVNMNSNAYTPAFATSSNSNVSTNGNQKSDLILQIENFNNNRNSDVKQLMEEAEFYRKTH